MAERGNVYGFDKEVRAKLDSKYDPVKEEEARNWINQVLGEEVFSGSGADEVHATLKDGKVLCRLGNRLGGKLKVNEQKMPFKQMENIGNFLEYVGTDLGVAKNDLFQTVDLYEKSNMWNAFAMGKDVPQLGPKESTKNPRHFTQQQLNKGKSVINTYQMGPSARNVATQSGQTFGGQRQIINHTK